MRPYDEQVRLWNGPPDARMIGSFDEAVCALMDDSGFTHVLKNDPASLRTEVKDVMVELDKAIALVDGFQAPMDIIESEQMALLRRLAGKALTIIYRVGLEVGD